MRETPAPAAGEQGRFEAYHDVLYEKQDSLGLLSFNALAKRAGVADSARFGSCVTRSDSVANITADVRFAQANQLPGTPAILLDGKLSSKGPPSIDSIEAALKRSGARATASAR